MLLEVFTQSVVYHVSTSNHQLSICTRNQNCLVPPIAKIKLRSQNSKMGQVTLTTPLLGWFVIHRLRSAVLNLPTKLDICISTGYEDKKSDAKCNQALCSL